MKRRALLSALPLAFPLALLAACADDAARSHLWGFGDPVRGAALNAPRQFGDLSRWQGQPDQAALALVQIEFLAQALATDPFYTAQVSPTVVIQLQQARDQARDHLGIRRDAAPEAVMAALRQAAAAVRDGRMASAEAALSGPDFTLGGAATLRRLSALPRLPRASEAAGAVNAELRRMDGSPRR
ncbi:hypothetical protein [Roseomonas sp. KE0001]|uniref:hypothetical protein n=1 Tax=unclassified Roseomonas TaxID=2617492 RepID=UPI0018DFAF8B|nr:hypothetical protein [Roseomonas sp. KE0001]MBI0432425.1 hypothetical protein [Roseomonas sp. KE0001]